MIFGALSGTAITHLDYRYQGIFGLLGQSLYERARKRGIQLIYGYPTSHNKQGLTGRLGWKITDNNILYCWDMLNRIDNTCRLSIIEIKNFDERIDLLWKKFLNGPYRNSTMVVRDSAYLQWRFVEKPGTGYYAFVAEQKGYFQGYIILRINTKPWEITGDIEDIVAMDTVVFKELVNHSFYFFKETGCVRLLLSNHSPYYTAALSMGFKESDITVSFGWSEISSQAKKNIYFWEIGLGEKRS